MGHFSAHIYTMLTREMSHRSKNSLASVVGLLRVQSRSAQSPEVRVPSRGAYSQRNLEMHESDLVARYDNVCKI